MKNEVTIEDTFDKLSKQTRPQWHKQQGTLREGAFWSKNQKSITKEHFDYECETRIFTTEEEWLAIVAARLAQGEQQ